MDRLTNEFEVKQEKQEARKFSENLEWTLRISASNVWGKKSPDWKTWLRLEPTMFWQNRIKQIINQKRKTVGGANDGFCTSFIFSTFFSAAVKMHDRTQPVILLLVCFSTDCIWLKPKF